MFTHGSDKTKHNILLYSKMFAHFIRHLLGNHKMAGTLGSQQ
jgi:hypothetical protein